MLYTFLDAEDRGVNKIDEFSILIIPWNIHFT